MRNIYLKFLIFFIFSFHILSGQSFQRMAIPKGTFSLAPRGVSKVTSYCLDLTREAPTLGINFANILSGGANAIVSITNAAGNVSNIPLKQAIDQDLIKIEGADLFDHTQLKFVNNTSDAIEIKLSENLQLGSETEKSAVKGVEKLELSSNPDEQYVIQEKVWNLREEENIKQLEMLGFKEETNSVNNSIWYPEPNLYQQFQEKFDLEIPEENIGVLDEITENKIVEEINKLQDQLTHIGFGGGLENAIEAYKKHKGIETEGYFNSNLYSLLKKDIDEGKFYGTNGKAHKTVHLEMPNGKERFFELETGFYVRFRNGSRLEEINKILENRFYLQEEIEVISLVNDATTTEVLRRNFPNNHMEFNLNSMQDFWQKLKKNKRKSVFILGHIENDAFITPLNNGKKFSLPLKNLQRLMKELDINIFPLGCNSGQYTTGMGNKFNSIDALNQLKPAVENNSTFKGMLQDLAGEDLKVIIDDNLLEDRGYLVAKIARQRTQASIATISGIGAGAGLIIYFNNKKGDSDKDDKTSETSDQNK